MANKTVMSLGLHPDVVNYSLFPGLTKERLTGALKAQEEHLTKLPRSAQQKVRGDNAARLYGLA